MDPDALQREVDVWRSQDDTVSALLTQARGSFQVHGSFQTRVRNRWLPL